jgi:predicted dehydrogenase
MLVIRELWQIHTWEILQNFNQVLEFQWDTMILKIIEAKKFLEAYLGGPKLNSNIHDAVAAAKVVTAAEESAASGKWIKISPTAGTTAAIK